ncbi:MULTISPECIES: hypothetical protein [unclassified Pseudomonas]|uniref:DUF7210 family protein n=1 Tax=unclassified Pseudomonas TaxID=196821 RepID=UPI00244AE089|nr:MULTISPECIES: hypothetical protein [unclassified Pseudomonas]MDG9928533.1 hypothetical protein [Pseudomonas sp. GD04042]MDH0482703.1 hypothetical protein [Pseudomonas sp. GD04015]MDH0604595.1 hypothetical protein [Pseudomonas sp. GD03869]
MSKPKTEAAEAAPELIEVILAKPHTHKGKEYAKGEKIKVTAQQKEWLKKREVVGGD